MRRHGSIALPVLLAATLAAAQPAQAEGVPTQVRVRAIARDAKLIGSGVGGARITVREAATGRVLVQGRQEGGTGDTRLIMGPRPRGAAVFDTPGAAGFLAPIVLERPTVVEITAEGPLGTPQSTQRASKTLLVVPGRHILGEGVLLEIHGFTLALLAPAADGRARVGRQV
ncbi:MAG: hypothetical protein ACE5HB_09225, partial [Terriglobia bacterium]